MSARSAGPEGPGKDGRDRPSALFTWIVSAALPGDRRGRSILGDLIEEWHARPPGPSRAIWYALESVRIAIRYVFVRRRLPGAERGPSPRAGLGGQVLEMAGRMLHDLRHAIRGLRHQARFTVAAVAVLALGIGSAAAIFAAFQAVVVQDLPVVEPDRLVRLSLASASGAAVTLTPEEIEALASESRTLRAAGGVLAIGVEAFPLTEGDRPLVLGMSSVTADLFDVLGARPALGRLLRPADGEEGAAPVAVITYGAWQRDFGGDPEVIGRRLTQTQTRRSYTVVGVAPPGLDIPVGVGYWIPTGPPGQRAFGGASMDVVARVADGVSPDAARTEFLALARALDAQRSRPSLPMTAFVRSLRDTVLGDVRPMIVGITTAVGLLLLIACVNVGGLVMIRTANRTREIMVRRALGASSGDVLRLLLLESLLIGTAGGVLGLGLAVWLLRMLPSVVPLRLPRSEMLGLVGAPLGVALSVTLTALLLFGVLPPLLAARGDVAPALRVDGRSGGGTLGGSRARRGLVAVQVSLAVILLFAGGLVARSLHRLQEIDLGYDAERVGVIEVSLDRSGQGPAETFALLADVLDRMREAPGVSSATWIMSRPFLGATGILSVRPMLEGQSEERAEANPRFPVEVGGGELFRTLGIPIVRGRGLLETDREDAPRVAVVSESVARRLWPDQDPVGQRIRMVTSRPSWWTVVGVAGDTRFRRLRERTPTIYVQYRQLQILPAAWTVAVRTDGELDAVLPDIRRVLDELDGRVQVWRAGALSDHLADGPLAEPRMSAFVLSGFGLSALLLAAIGLYGVMALAVRERMHELGVRRALGASARRLRWEVLGDALAVLSVGTVVGLGGALVMSRRLTPLLYEVEPWDLTTMLAVCAMLLGVGVLAALLPARRATAADPMEVLRAD